MQTLLLFGVLLAGLYLGFRRLRRVDPVRAAQALRWAVLGGLALLLLLLSARGNSVLAVPLLTLLLPLALRYWQSLRSSLAGAGPGGPGSSSQSAPPGGHSTVHTRFLRMSLDHLSGEIQGTVLQGRFTGRSVSDLSAPELLALWRECRADAQSTAVLEAYLDRTLGADWREQARESQEDTAYREKPRAPGSAMNSQEAYEILGLPPGAGVEEIKAAHRRLMQRVHPDHGGSTYLAARINQAKDVLLKERFD